MTFRIAVVPHFWQLVEHELIGDLGTTIKISFKVKYRRPDQAEVEDLVRRVLEKAQSVFQAPASAVAVPQADASQVANGTKDITDQEIVDKYVLDWDDVLGDDDAPLPYTQDNLARANKLLGVRGAMVRTFLDNFLKAPEKNFAARPATSTQ